MNADPPCPCGARRAGKLPRAAHASGWFLPGAILLLMPKCPACLAVWLAAGTGIGVSLTAAAWLRTGLILFCTGALLLLTLGIVRRFRHQALTTARRSN